MTHDEQRKEFDRLRKNDTIESSIELLDLFIDYLFQTIAQYKGKSYYGNIEADAAIVNQMMFTKLLNIRKLLLGIQYKSRDGNHSLNNVTDPTSIAPLVRTLYETYATFYMIYVLPDSQPKKEMIYKLWVIAGLKYRQRFRLNMAESVAKKEEEKNEIDNLVKSIKDSDLYTQLPQV